MTEALVPVVETPPAAAPTSGMARPSSAALALPQMIVDAGPAAAERFLEFSGRIANERTRSAYARAVGQFLGWCEVRGLRLEAIAPLHVAAYIRTHPGSAPTVKQHLAAIRMLCDWLVVNQVLPVNPAAAVRGPKHVVTKGATPVLSPAEARKLLKHIDTGTLAGLRDRALLSVMLYSFARVSAVLGMRRADYFLPGEPRVAAAPREGREAARRAGPPPGGGGPRRIPHVGRARGTEGGALPERGPGWAPADGKSVSAAHRPGDDQASGGCRGAPALDVLPHVPGDGDHGVLVERGDPRARPADRGACIAEDDEALRPDSGHDHGR